MLTARSSNSTAEALPAHIRRSAAFLFHRDTRTAAPRPAGPCPAAHGRAPAGRLPAVLSVEEITLLLQAAPGPKYKAAFATAYGAGLRVSEVVALKVGDIDSERMLLRVEQGKGRKDRDPILSPH